jgi:hypothetical protein
MKMNKASERELLTKLRLQAVGGLIEVAQALGCFYYDEPYVDAETQEIIIRTGIKCSNKGYEMLKDNLQNDHWIQRESYGRIKHY